MEKLTWKALPRPHAQALVAPLEREAQTPAGPHGGGAVSRVRQKPVALQGTLAGSACPGGLARLREGRRRLDKLPWG